MAKKTKFNHARRIKNLQSAMVKSIYPGHIVQFKYSGKNISDKQPMVLILWNDYDGYKIHGVNLNYMTENTIKNLLNEVVEKGVKKKADTPVVVDEDQTGDYAADKPYRNMLKDPYTRIKLPTYKEKGKDGRVMSKAEAIKQIDRLYEKKLKRIVKKNDIYRSYLQNKMSSIKVVTYDIEGLIK